MPLSVHPFHTLTLLSCLGLAGCAELGAVGAEAGTAAAIAEEGTFPPECGVANAASDADSFAYAVADLDGCNDIQSFSFDFTWSHGPVFAVSSALSSGSVEVRITPEGGEPTEATVDAENPNAVFADIYTDCAELEAGVGPGTVTVRLLLSDAAGSLDVAANDDTQEESWYYDEMCGS